MAMSSMNPLNLFVRRALAQWATMSTAHLRVVNNPDARNISSTSSSLTKSSRGIRALNVKSAALRSQHSSVNFFMARSVHSGQMNEDFVFRQLLDYKSYTYTYLLADAATKESVLIDPVIETVERDFRLIQDLGLNLIFAANTHVHADHITGTGEMKKRIPTCKSMIAQVSNAKADVHLKEGDKIRFGKFELEVRSTPGHTDGCMSFVWHEKGMAFTGDALLIRGCGRTDFQQGNAGVLYDSVHNKILSLPQHFKLFPAHDYTGQTMSTVAEELRFNPRLTRPKSEFIHIMEKLSLPYPKQIDKALPANMVCGVFEVPTAAST